MSNLALRIVAASCCFTMLAGCQTPPHRASNSVSPTPSAPAAAPRAVADFVTKALATMDGGWHAQGLQWSRAKTVAQRETAHAQTVEETLPALRKALMVAGGEHSSILLTPDAQTAKAAATTQPSGIPDTVMPVLELPTFAGGTDAADQAYAAAASRLINSQQRRGTCGWVIDLRYNSGGNAYPMLAAVTPFLTPGVIVGISSPHQPVTIRLRDNHLYYDNERIGVHSTATHRFTGPVAVLQGSGTASSAEFTLLALASEQHVKTFGQDTMGMSSGNQEFAIGSTAVVNLTIGPMRDRAGKTYGGAIRPDQKTERGAELGQARKWLKSACSARQ